MGSLNGDIMVMRNGRSTSQVSVYNYPEHLNPFYEDDQHKRLRFWKISKKDNEGRRNSFSIGNLKDMWAFRTFRMKKKSSTLGINKTSESPPLLRRDYVLENGWSTFDHRLRASNTPSMNGDNFQRNATYRSSLQTLPTNNDRIGLNRNDGYRSTIQVPRSNPRYQPQQRQQQLQQTMGVSQNRRYVYGGSITPQPLRNSRTYVGRGPYEYDSDNDMIRGSSQSSMVSSNPFESDEDENEDINSSILRSAVNGSTTTLTSRTPRKKRRAPPPPTVVQGRNNGTPLPTIRIESSHENIQDELCIKEDIDIANLTAEIESFVKTKSNDDIEISLTDKVQTETTSNSGNAEKIVAKQIAEESHEIAPVLKDTSTTLITAEGIDTLSKEKINTAEKVNGQIVTETTAVKTTADVIKPTEKETDLTKVSNKIESKIIESKEIKTNGAIPKKPTNNSIISSSDEQQHLQQQSTPIATDLCIKEMNTKELQQKPVPLKRQTIPEAEVGHVECIHVHVESPRTTPRKEHPNSLSSFKTTESLESPEIITTKTPFVLASPPVQRKNLQQMKNAAPVTKETVKIIETSTASQTIKDLNIKEERSNIKPEISIKPTLSPKPFTKESNGKVHSFAEIHKPMRRNTQNGHVRRTSHDDGSICPPFVPQRKTKEGEDEKINNSNYFQINDCKGKKGVEVKQTKFEVVDNLKIIETTTAVNGNGGFKPVTEENDNEIEETTVSKSTSIFSPKNRKEMQNREDEFDQLYRPKPTSHMEWKQSTLAPLETNIPPEKRKSVKDIIESINRSQRLLNAAANKDFTALHNHNAITTNSADTTITTTAVNNNNNLNENLKILDEGSKEIQHLVDEMTSSTDTGDLANTANSPSPSPSNCNNESTELQKLDNSEIFKKCKVKKEVYDYRETSPITSNLDWNPVPKPKRTKPGYE